MEQVLNEILYTVTDICPQINVMQARMKIAGILSMYEIKPSNFVPGHPDIKQKIKSYLAAKKLEGLSPLTISGYKIELRIFAKYIQKPVSSITTSDIRAYLGQFDYLKLSSLSTKLSTLKSFFGWLTDEEVILKNPTRKLKTPKESKRLPDALTLEELEIARESCKTLRQKAFVELAYASGCRLSELVSLDRSNIDWNRSVIRVIGKGDKERIVPISHRAIFHLKKYLKSREDLLPAIFITEKRPYRRLSDRAVQREVSIVGKNAGFAKNLHPHVFRHTLAMNLLNNGAELSVVQQILGHSTPNTTQIYAKATMRYVQEQYLQHHIQ